MGSACHVTQKSSVLSRPIVLSAQWPCSDSDMRQVGIPLGKSSRMVLMLTTSSLGLSACLLSAVHCATQQSLEMCQEEGSTRRFLSMCGFIGLHAL